MPRPSLRKMIPTLAGCLLLLGCGPQPGASTPPGSVAPIKLTVGLGYIPSVQFAPFYLADQKGYYADAGLAVTFQNKIDPDLVALVGQGTLFIGVADAT